MHTSRGFISLGLILLLFIGIAAIGSGAWYASKQNGISTQPIEMSTTTTSVQPAGQPSTVPATSPGKISALPPGVPSTIGYGSRAGMVVSVVSADGLDTAHAVIRTEHTRENATAFCEEYLNQHPATETCIQKILATRLADQITADCTTGEFTDFYGGRYQFLGANPHPDQSDPSVAKYQVKDLSTGEILANAGVTGYHTKMNIHKALCPSKSPAQPF